MKDIIETVVRGLNTKVGFYFGEPSEINATSEGETNDVIVCLLPYSKEADMMKPGTTKSKNRLNMLFLKRSNLDQDHSTRESSYLGPMERLADEFIHRLKDYMNKEIKPPVEPISGYRQLVSKINEFDLNGDGVLLSFDVPRSLNFSYCLTNYTFTILSDGAAVNNNFTWLYPISEVSTDGTTFGSSATLAGGLVINAGSGTTGSYTFTPSANQNYTFSRRVWVKWDNDLVTPMNFKVVYTYTG